MGNVGGEAGRESGGRRGKAADGVIALAEMKEFAGFSAATQRYIRRSLDIGLDRADAIARWSRDRDEAASIQAQARAYRRLDLVRRHVPDDDSLDRIDPFFSQLLTLTAFDLGANRLGSFAAYRFLYERLIGGDVRPWLPAAFCAAAALPHLHPDRRRLLLQSIGETAATAPGWSSRTPCFFPEWVDKVEVTLPN